MALQCSCEYLYYWTPAASSCSMELQYMAGHKKPYLLDSMRSLSNIHNTATVCIIIQFQRPAWINSDVLENFLYLLWDNNPKMRQCQCLTAATTAQYARNPEGWMGQRQQSWRKRVQPVIHGLRLRVGALIIITDMTGSEATGDMAQGGCTDYNYRHDRIGGYRRHWCSGIRYLYRAHRYRKCIVASTTDASDRT